MHTRRTPLALVNAGDAGMRLLIHPIGWVAGIKEAWDKSSGLGVGLGLIDSGQGGRPGDPIGFEVMVLLELPHSRFGPRSKSMVCGKGTAVAVRVAKLIELVL